ncbi:hypothetical protein HXX76_013068 [Chlamydomonas incerta]|uniref:Uncharacterized protein n=1 Tax=Chlamydomonas incerta TaxID=51695 RepID=A0A835VV57_CHLIN|nr:hypothetical protein HXX76_013068 [Chlamydomonas incerta]|eukprot:KAG2426311.1 hypothetical protein HXX76_013068 [Chlamydomonas incerta]
MDPEDAPLASAEGADPAEAATEELQADGPGAASGGVAEDDVEPGAGADAEAEAEPPAEAEAVEGGGPGDDSYADDAFHEHEGADEAADAAEATEANEADAATDAAADADAGADADGGAAEPSGAGEEGAGGEEVPEPTGGKILTYISPSFERAASAVYRMQADPEELAAAKAAVLAAIPSAAPSRNASSVARPASGAGSASGSAAAAAAAAAGGPASGAASKRESFSSQTASAAPAPPAASEAAPGPGSSAGSKPGSKAASFSSATAPPASAAASVTAGGGAASRGASFSSAAPAAAPEASAASASSSSMLRRQQSGASAAAADAGPQASAPSASGAASGAASRATSFVGLGQLSQSQSQSQRQGSRPASTEPLEPSAPSASSAAAPPPPLPPRGQSFASNASGPVRRAPSTSSSAGQPGAEPSLAPAAAMSPPATATQPAPPLPPLPGSAAGSRPRSAASASGSAAAAAASDPAAPASPQPPPEPSSPLPPPPPPHHLSTTRVQPKGPLDACAAQSASEHVRTVWSTANICGIRSLPNALNPDFRERLYQELVAAAQRERAGDTSGDRGRRADLSYGLEGGPLAMPLSVGQKQVARIHPLSGMFTQFEYLPSEFDRVKLMGKFDRLKHKLSQTTPAEFVVRAPPAPPRGAPAFSEFAYVTDPAEGYDSSVLADNDVGRSKVVAGPFYPAGRPKSAASLKGRLDECMMGLCRQLSEDWPTGFLQIFEDSNGSVVVSFDKSRAVSEGDLTSYMNTLAKRHHLVAAFHLLKDATQWGLVDGDTGAVFYVLWPPWVRHKYLGPHAAAAFGETANGRPGTRGSDSSDEEGGGGDGSGGAYDGEEGPRSGGGLLESYGDGASMGLGSTATGLGGDGYGRMGSAMRVG